ncbi:isoleucyl-tRNA synthetase [Hydrogenispora ethanolica]|uniref:Isoleucine--tRNA ligase n=1 Tax=Hydrogenispora ethanolica TaxID=1082276 RepID=A0A4R1R8V0_HYDET|nr:isoleucine--tRNA ligase [Hydrogenispora ethanolica]TCL62086.1 isoleucyl-tRNA synthetase [Hydrogenispora ethanolica]
MGKFWDVETKVPVNQREETMLQKWQAEKIIERSVSEREGAPRFIFYEGPPTANGKPGIHHVLARTLKDTVCRYQTMQGYQVNRKAGWDTHGLPVELEVEKQLGFSSKQQIEAYGIEGFNTKCRESVFTYEREWRRMTERIGYWIDMDHPYITLDNNYIESVWWILKRFFDEGMIYEGHKIMPYCPRCGTPLASHEVSLGYKDETIDSIYIRMKAADRPDEYFLVWTTTPWTLPSNVALAVNPEFTYVRARRPEDEAVYILVRERVEAVLGKEAEILEEFKGEALLGRAYEQFLPFIRTDSATAFKVYGADFVSTEDGTGIVHIAPAFGEDDYQLGKKYDLPVLQPVDKEGKFTAVITPWAGRFVREADKDITRYLKAEGKLFSKERLTHSYPYCWRCDTSLLYYARKSWYIATTKYKERLIAANQKVNWFPEHVGKGRFGNWLENMIDWAISRDRYWGTPLNIWRCETCNKLTSVGSRQELAERAIEPVDPAAIELHRPYIDDVHLRCECGGRMTRTTEVIDCWFDSGSMPVAQWHYPFEHQDDFDQLFPADFICEGIDQTRGWFYSLLAIGAFLFGEPPYKNVLVNDLLLDKNGQKMSKTRGNAVDPWQMLEKYGADATRWYLLAVSPPWTPTRFDEDGLKDVSAKFFGTLQNVYSFFTLYANIDGADPASYRIPEAERPEIDRWILSKLNSLIAEVREDMKEYDLTRVVRAIQSFLIDEVSNWYVRRTRDRFWASAMDRDKQAVYRTLWEVLLAVVKLMAPFAPFLADEIYRNLIQGAPGAKDSVHLELYPEANLSLIDKTLEEHMGLVIDLVSLGRAARNKVQIKVRQPLATMLVDRKHQSELTPMAELVKEELNLKTLEFIDAPDAYVVYTVKPNFPVLGPKYGKLLGAIGAALGKSDAATLVKELRGSGVIKLDANGTEVILGQEDLEVRVQDREGFAVEMDHGRYIVLNLQLDQALIEEGLAREVVSKVQNMRKTQGLEMTDRIRLSFVSDDEVAAAMEHFREYVMAETLALVLERQPAATGKFEKWDINGHPAEIRVERQAQA